MITLTADTVKSVYTAREDVIIVVSSDSTTVTRLSKNMESLETAGGGQGLTAYNPLKVRLRAKEELFAISTGTPNLSVFEMNGDIRVI